MGTSTSGVFPDLLSVPPVKEEAQQKQKSYVTNYVKGQPPSDVSLPKIATGGIAPLVIGREVIRNPDIIWYGNLKNITETTSKQTTQTDTNTGIETITTTYTTTIIGYRIDVQFMVGLGPGCRLRTIYLDNAPVWTGTKGPARDTFTVLNNELIKDVIFAGGNFDQAIDPYLDALITEPLTAYRGMAYVVLTGLDTAKMSNIAFEVDRYPDPLSLGAHNKIGEDINPVSAMVDIITSTWGGAGESISKIGSSFADAAEVLYAEGNGASLINRQTASANALNNIILDQIDGTIYEDQSTGKIELKLSRNTFDPATVVRLFDKDILSMTGDKGSWQSSPTSIKVSYVDRSYDYRTIPLVARNLAANGKLSKSMVTLDFPAVRNGSLASKLLGRDGAKTGSPIGTLNIIAGRKAARLNPGDIVIITSEKYKYYSVPAIVTKRRTQPSKDNSVTLTCNIILYPKNTTIFAAPEPSFFVPVDPSPHAPTSVKIMSAPWALKATRGPVALYGNFDVNYNWNVQTDQILLLGNAYNAAQQAMRVRYHNTVSNTDIIVNSPANSIIDPLSGDPSGLTDGDFPYPVVAKLTTAIDKYDNWDNSSATQQIVIHDIGPSNVMIQNILAGFNAGNNNAAIILIDDEIFTVSKSLDIGTAAIVFDLSLRTATFTAVRRGLADTVAQNHAVNADVYVIAVPNNHTSIRGFPFATSVDYLCTGMSSPKNSLSESNISVAFGISYTGTDRGARPLRPHDTKINGARGTSSPTALVRASTPTITWAIRGRSIANSFTVKKDFPWQTDASQPGEVLAGKHIAYRVWISDSAAVDWDCGLTVDTADHSSLVITVPAGAAVGNGFLWVDAEFDAGLGVKTSQFKDKLPIVLS